MSDQVNEKKSVKVRRMIAEVEEAMKYKVASSVAAQFPEYEKEFPAIFKILVNPNSELYPPNVLEMMITQLEKIENGESNQHDASVAVGSVLVNKFVKPNLK
jgi:hypothetical protein